MLSTSSSRKHLFLRYCVTVPMLQLSLKGQVAGGQGGGWEKDSSPRSRMESGKWEPLG